MRNVPWVVAAGNVRRATSIARVHIAVRSETGTTMCGACATETKSHAADSSTMGTRAERGPAPRSARRWRRKLNRAMYATSTGSRTGNMWPFATAYARTGFRLDPSVERRITLPSGPAAIMRTLARRANSATAFVVTPRATGSSHLDEKILMSVARRAARVPLYLLSMKSKTHVPVRVSHSSASETAKYVRVPTRRIGRSAASTLAVPRTMVAVPPTMRPPYT